ncbi:hypothetical protein PF003_g13649 [Phytophthora fragariae]|nr:hypothetical protein PF003_g13649 [Phytophthora fragariae]
MLAGGGGCSTEDSGAAEDVWPGGEAVGGASSRGRDSGEGAPVGRRG